MSRDGAYVTDPDDPAQAAWSFWRQVDALSYDGIHPAECPWLGSSGQPPITRYVQDRVALPSPSTQPSSRAVTGKPTYLVTGGSTTYPRTTFATTIAGFPVSWEVEATGAFVVDWGDGTVTGPHETVGEPWPDGDITHTYTEPGTYTITLTQEWTVRYRRTAPAPQARWSSFTMTTGPWLIPDYQVTELQPVREH